MHFLSLLSSFKEKGMWRAGKAGDVMYPVWARKVPGLSLSSS